MAEKPVHVLFAMSDTGGGHRSAAVAIGAALDYARPQQVRYEIRDLLRETGVPGVRNAPNLYDHLSTRWLRVYDLGYQLTNEVRLIDTLSRLVYLQARRNIARMLLSTRPQMVVVTHPLVHRFVCAARREYRLPCRVITVVTDLVTFHASWTYPGVDLCLLPTDEAFSLMRRRGMRPDRMVRTGFPVHPKFAYYDVDQVATRRRLGLAGDRFTLLVTGGGVGSGRVGELVPALERAYPDLQLLVVTGKNRLLYDELRSRSHSPHTHIYGFVDNMEELMAASDVIVTKAGPGTLMEALVMRRPVIVTEAVGMQERGNIDLVLNYELGMYCPTVDRMIAAVGELRDEQRYAATVQRLQDAVPRHGATQIAGIIGDQLVHTRPWSADSLSRRFRRRPVQLRSGPAGTNREA